MEISPWRPSGAEQEKESRLQEEPCLFNLTHWYSNVRVASCSLNGRGIQPGTPSTRSCADRPCGELPTYAAQNPQIKMGPINNHIVSSYFIPYTELYETKFASEIMEYFFCISKLHLNILNVHVFLTSACWISGFVNAVVL